MVHSGAANVRHYRRFLAAFAVEPDRPAFVVGFVAFVVLAGDFPRLLAPARLAGFVVRAGPPSA